MLAQHLRGHSQVTMQAAALLGKAVDVQAYLDTDQPDVGIASMCNAVEAVLLLSKTSNKRAVIELLQDDVYASLWLCPQVWIDLVSCTRKGRSRDLECSLFRFGKNGPWTLE